MLKLAVPTIYAQSRYIGQVAYGVDTLPDNGIEVVAQKWTAIVSREQDRAVDLRQRGNVRIELPSRDDVPDAPAFAFVLRRAQGQGPILARESIRASGCSDSGSTPARRSSDWEAIDGEALAKNEAPYALSFFPSGEGQRAERGIVLSDAVTQVTALKLAEEGEDLIIRLYEPTGQARTTMLSLPFAGMETTVSPRRRRDQDIARRSDGQAIRGGKPAGRTRHRPEPDAPRSPASRSPATGR